MGFRSIMALETITGDLRAYAQLENGTFQHVDQLQAERQSNLGLRDHWFYTADGNGYFLRDGGVDWVITREAENLVLRHLDAPDSSYDQLVNTGNYRPGNVEAQSAKGAESTVVVDMNQLRLLCLSGPVEEWRYLRIRTEDGFILTGDGYEAPNEEEQKVLTRLGYTSGTFKMLRESEQHIEGTCIYVLNPAYVAKEVAKDLEHDSLWRASWLLDFNGDSYFDASLRDIDFHGRLRGVLASGASNVPEGHDAPETDYASYYKALLANPAEAVEALDDAIVAGLSKIIADYQAQ